MAHTPAERGASVHPLPELLAPAGDWECARAAVENGADAIYFGLDRFNARMRAHNFTEADLPELMKYLHGRGVKGYVTLNTLVFQNEVAAAEKYLRAMILAGVDAVIVQDVGIARLIRKLSPDFPIHASTQMTVTSAEGVAFARELGCNLVVLARECSLQEIGKIRQARTQSSEAGKEGGAMDMPLEVFVHGALCVAYSGQCLTSESLGGRSANRGECAQACRMPYGLIADGQRVPLGDRRYLLSPQDLAGLEVLPQLVSLGVASLKIEGRLKSPEYVANITRVYRAALDELALAERGPTPGSFPAESEKRFAHRVAASRYDLEMAFSRGLHTGWFGGINNQQLVHAHFGKKRGVYLGRVSRIHRRHIGVALEAPLKPGDGIVFDCGHPEEKEEGGRVYSVEQRGTEALLSFGTGDIELQRIHVGDKAWKTSDPELEGRLRQTFCGAKPRCRRPVDLEAHGTAGQPLTLVARDEMGHVVQVQSTMPLTAAHGQPLTPARLREHLGRLGETGFQLRELGWHLAENVILPLSELNRLRRAWVQELQSRREAPARWTVCEASEVGDVGGLAEPPPRPVELTVLVRNLAQLEAALPRGISRFYCELEDPRKYRDAVRLFRQWQSQAGAERSTLFVAPPRIFKMGEDWILNQVRSSEPDGFLVRNYDQLRFFAGCRCIGDYSLNIANALAAQYFMGRFNLERVTASYDLNSAQLEALLRAAPPAWFEVTVHQHMPMFHMEHCVFCAFLSKGTDYTNCGRPCDQHEVQLEDRAGARHPVKADAGCRNTVFNALAQTGAEHVSRMQELGVRHFRVEFLNESPDRVLRTIEQYQKLLSGQISGSALWRELKLFNQLGVTRGPLAQRT